MTHSPSGPAPTARPGRAFGRSHQSLGGSAPVAAAGPRGIWRGAPSGGAARGGSARVVTGWGRGTSRGAGPAVAGGGATVGAGSRVTAPTVPALTAGAGATGGQRPPAWPFPAQGQAGGGTTGGGGSRVRDPKAAGTKAGAQAVGHGLLWPCRPLA